MSEPDDKPRADLTTAMIVIIAVAAIAAAAYLLAFDAPGYSIAGVGG